MKNNKTNIFLLAMLAASPLMATAQNADGADSIAAKKKVHVAFRDMDADRLLGGVSYIDMEELQKKNYTVGSLDDLYALVGGWNGTNLWGQDNGNLDNNDNSNRPLVIIDGVKRPSNNVLPSEIEQVTFLKGAQAVVLYGPKAVKGAILITTKRGKVDGLQIVANANTGFHVAKAFPEYLGSAEYMTLYNEACLNDQLVTGAKYSQQDIYNYASGSNPYRYPNVNLYSSDYIRKAYNRSEGTLEVQGGGQRAHFYTNINYYRLEDLINFGPAKDNYTDRFSVRGNVDLIVNKAVKGFANATATFYNANKNKGDFWGEAATMRPNRPGTYAPLLPYDMVDPNATMALGTLGKSLNLLDGKYVPGGNKKGDEGETNAIADCYFGGKTTSVSRQFQFDAGLVYDMSRFVKGLSFTTQFAIDYAASYSMSYNNKYAVFAPTWSNYNSTDAIVAITQYGDEVVTGTMGMSDAAYRQIISWNGHFNYDHTFGGKHHVTGLLVGNMYTTTTTGEYHRYTNANLGLQAGYDYMGRYFADISLAGVHSSRLPEGNREAISPSFTVGWNLAKENFMKDSFVDDLMISASYSNLNEDMDVYLGNREYYVYNASWDMESSNFSWGEANSVGLTYSKSGSNPVLDYIHRKEFSASIRGSFFDRLLSADITFFNTNMTGYIIQDPTTFPSYLSGGLSSSSFKPAINNNETNRKGIDFNIKAQKQFGKLHAELGITGTFLWTRTTKYDEICQYDYKKSEGKAIDALWGYECLGFYTNDDFNITTSDGKTVYTLKDGIPVSKLGGSIQPGDLKYRDINNDGVISTEDKVELAKSGTYGSPYDFGMNLTLKYKNFTLFVLGSAQFGAYGMRNSSSYYYMQGEDKYSVNALGRWTPATAETATHPRLTTSSHNHNASPSTFWMYSKDNFSLDKVQLTYDFPKDMIKCLKVVNGLSVYMNGNELLRVGRWRKLMDTNVGYAPQTRFYNLGVKVTF